MLFRLICAFEFFQNLKKKYEMNDKSYCKSVHHLLYCRVTQPCDEVHISTRRICWGVTAYAGVCGGDGVGLQGQMQWRTPQFNSLTS